MLYNKFNVAAVLAFGVVIVAGFIVIVALGADSDKFVEFLKWLLPLAGMGFIQLLTVQGIKKVDTQTNGALKQQFNDQTETLKQHIDDAVTANAQSPSTDQSKF